MQKRNSLLADANRERERRDAVDSNIGPVERLLSLIAGGALLWRAVGRDVLGAVLTIAGVSLVLRGLTGYWPVYAAPGAGRVGRGRAAQATPAVPAQVPHTVGATVEPAPPGVEDMVDEAIWESFPASDPPSWTR